MPKQVTHALLGLLVLFFAVTGCTVIVSPTSSADECPTSVTISGAERALVVNQALDLIATPNGGNNLNYSWAWFFDGELIDTKSTAHVTPADPGAFEISVVVTAPGCNGGVSDSFQVVVAAAEVAEIPESAEPTSTSTAAPTDTPAAPAATRTPTPTETPETPTPTETVVVVGTAVVPPTTQPSLSSPVITGYTTLPGGAFIISWSWDRVLEPHWRYAVRLWPVDKPEEKHSLVWQRETAYQTKVLNEEFPEGDYFANIAVVYENGSTWVSVSESDTRLVHIPESPVFSSTDSNELP